MADEGSHDLQQPVIFIDQEEYRPSSDDVTGDQLRNLVQPPIGPDRDLWLDVPGGSDRKIGGDEEIEVRNGMHFFTAPAQINPGSDAVGD